MRTRLSILIVFCMMAFSIAAHADTFNYQLIGTTESLDDTPSIMGTFTVNTTMGGILFSTNFTFNNPYTSTIDVFNTTSTDFVVAPDDSYATITFTSVNGDFILRIPNGGGPFIPVCSSVLFPCLTSDETADPVFSSIEGHDITAGILLGSEVSPVPEPSSFLLLGSGLMGTAGVARRRFLNR